MSILDYWLIREFVEGREGRKTDQGYWSKVILLVLGVVIVVGGVLAGWEWVKGLVGF